MIGFQTIALHLLQNNIVLYYKCFGKECVDEYNILVSILVVEREMEFGRIEYVFHVNIENGLQEI